MKETKVYVDELPKSCVGCKYFAEHRRQCNLELCLQWNEVKFKFNDCPLIDIKTHDRALVKEVCEKIKNEAYKDGFYDEDGNKIITYHINNYILDQIQRNLDNE